MPNHDRQEFSKVQQKFKSKINCQANEDTSDHVQTPTFGADVKDWKFKVYIEWK